MRQKRHVFYNILLVLLLTGCTTDPILPQDEPYGPFKVIKVVDGDTMKIEKDGSTETLRLIGIDTPETVDPRKPVQCYGPEASKRAHVLLDNQSVYIGHDFTQGNRDKYNRLLVYVWINLSEDPYNLKMITEGYAKEYTYDKPYRYQIAFRQAEDLAQRQERGLWGACNST